MRMLFDGKACINGCTFCCSAICQGGFLNCHTIFMSISLSLISLHSVTPLMKGQAWNVWRGTQSTRWQFCSLFFVEHSLTYFTKCHAAYQNFFFPLFAWSLTVQVTVMLRHGLDIASLQFSIVISPKDEYLWDWP